MMKLDAGDNESEKYEIETICNSAVYTRESKSSHLPGLYHLVFWEDYLEKKNIQKPILAVQHFKKLISLFYKNYFNIPKTTFKTINIASLMANPTIKPIVLK